MKKTHTKNGCRKTSDHVQNAAIDVLDIKIFSGGGGGGGGGQAPKPHHTLRGGGEKEKFKLVLSFTDRDLSKICIQGMYKMFMVRQV